MNALDLIRAQVAREAAPATAGAGPSPHQPQPTPQPPAAACPFTFGPWLPRTDPPARPGEAQRAIYRNGHHVGWWRRQWIAPVVLDGDPPPAPPPFQTNTITAPDGRILVSGADAQSALELFAFPIHGPCSPWPRQHITPRIP